jgi:hypothetical protein
LRERESLLYYEQTCPFTPKIADSSKPKLENFFNRLQSWVEKRNENFQREIEESNKDSKTGQPLFRPLTSKKDSSNSSSTDKHVRNVFIDLYEETKLFRENQKERENKYQEEIEKMANQRKATQQIEEINHMNKLECYRCLFEILDHDHDNSISFSQAFLNNLESRLNPEIIFIIDPIINELRANNLNLNYQEFIMVIEHLYRVINVDEKRRLINWYVDNIKRGRSPKKTRTFSQDFSFRPTITETSHKLYLKSKRISKDVFKRNTEFLEKKHNFIKEKNIEKLRNEVKG